MDDDSEHTYIFNDSSKNEESGPSSAFNESSRNDIVQYFQEFLFDSENIDGTLTELNTMIINILGEKNKISVSLSLPQNHTDNYHWWVMFSAFLDEPIFLGVVKEMLIG